MPSAVEENVISARAFAKAATELLLAAKAPAHARLFAQAVDEAKHHLSVATLKLSNALVVGLPGNGR